MGTISFHFNPRWEEDPSLSSLILGAWKNWIQGSPIFIWEHKLKSTKKEIRDWVQTKATHEKKEIKEMKTLWKRYEED